MASIPYNGGYVYIRRLMVLAVHRYFSPREWHEIGHLPHINVLGDVRF